MLNIKEEVFEDESIEESIEEEKVPVAKNQSLKCPTCDKDFWTRYLLQKHIARVHEKRYKKYEREKKYSCSYDGCDKAYTTPGLLRDHETAAHTAEKPFECGQCNQSFSGRSLFANHLRRRHKISIKDIEKLLNL